MQSLPWGSFFLIRVSAAVRISATPDLSSAPSRVVPSVVMRVSPNFSYDYLKPEQELYGIISGIGSDAHFGGDYQLGLSLGWAACWKSLRFIGKSIRSTRNFTTRRNW